MSKPLGVRPLVPKSKWHLVVVFGCRAEGTEIGVSGLGFSALSGQCLGPVDCPNSV